MTVARLFLCLIVLAVVEKPASSEDPGETVTIRLQPQQGVEIPEDFRLLVLPSSGSPVAKEGSREEPIVLDVEEMLGAEARGAYSITCSAKELWCPTLEGKPGVQEIFLAVFRSTVFEVQIDSAGKAPAEIRIQGWLGQERDQVFEETVTGEEGHFSFSGPAVSLDLRLAAADLQPIYLWDLKARVPIHSLGLIRMEAGSSICGFGIDADSGHVVEGAQVRLGLPGGAELPSSPLDAARRKLVERSGRTNARGFFQISGVEPGVYRLEVELDGEERRIATLDPVRVLENSESCFPEIALARESQVTLIVTPPLDLLNQAWNIVALTPGEDALLEGRGGGRYQAVLPRGRYRILIRDSSEDLVDSREIEIDDSDARIDVTLDFVRVSGFVSMGGDPMAVRIQVMAGQGDRRELETDEEGRFRGWIRRPKYPMLSFHLEPKELPAFEHRRIVRDFDPQADELEFAFELPSGSVEGVVVQSNGAPAFDSLVVAKKDGEETFRAWTDDEGHFSMKGVESGAWRLSASWSNAAWSREVEVRLKDEEEPTQVFLELEEVRQLEGRVLLFSGEAVAGARVGLWMPSPFAASAGGRTDIKGYFSLRIPAGAARGVLTVSGPVLWSGCVDLGARKESPPLTIRLPLESGQAQLLLRNRAKDSSSGLGFSALLTADGGFLSFSRLAGWARSQGVPFWVGKAGNRGEYQVPGLAPGLYAVHHSFKSKTDLAGAACARLVEGLNWTVVAAGGTTVIEDRWEFLVAPQEPL